MVSLVFFFCSFVSISLPVEGLPSFCPVFPWFFGVKMSTNEVLDPLCNNMEERHTDDNSLYHSDEDVAPVQKDSIRANEIIGEDSNEDVGKWVDDGDEGEHDWIS